MASKEEVSNLSAHREVLKSISLSDTGMSVEQNLYCAYAHHDSLMCQWMSAEDALEMAKLLDAKRQSMGPIIEEEHAYWAQVAALSQMQLQTMDRVEVQEKQLQRHSALLV